MKKQNKKHESGRSMIEMVGVLAVMGLITAAAFVLITSAMRSQKLSRADDDIAGLAAGVRLLYNNSTQTTGFAGLKDDANGAKTLVALGFDKVKPAYGSDTAYTISAAKDANGATCGASDTKCDYFNISFDTGDSAVCSGLKERTWANGGKATCSSSKLTITFDSGR